MSQRREENGCDVLRADLEELVDGDLGPEETARLESHLKECPACREDLEMARALKEELTALPQFDAPDRLVEAVLETASRESRQTSALWFVLRPAPVLALAAALALAIALPLIWREGTTGGDTGSTEIVESTSLADPEVQRAADEARLALAYVSRASRRVGLEIRDGAIVEHFVRPTAERFRLSRAGASPEERGVGDES
jgi:predicted anti-sigma-YlaC factor YlaD